MSLKRITVDIISDVQCPWCYVGQKRLHTAIGRYRSQNPNALPIDIKWHPFLLNPTMPKEGKNRKQYFLDKFGVDDLMKTRHGPHLVQAGKEEDIHFQLTKPDIVPYMIDAHRLLHLTAQQKPQVQDQVSASLFKKYFEQGADVSDVNVLKEIANEYQIEIPDGYFESNEHVDEIKHQAQRARVNGVPFFTFNGGYGVSGAQSAEVFLEVLNELSE
jgi:predicted DsbA family dithiol-disulfide isomerase